MHPAIHVAISVLIGLGMGINNKHRYAIIVLAAFLVNGLIDMDYIFYMRGIFDERYFSTGIVMLYIPGLILLGAHVYEKGSRRSLYTRIALLVMLISTSHLLLDTFSPDDAVYLYYPFSMTEYRLDQALLPYVAVLFAGVVVIINRLEYYLYRSNEGRKKRVRYVHDAPYLQRYDERLSRVKERMETFFK